MAMVAKDFNIHRIKAELVSCTHRDNVRTVAVGTFYFFAALLAGVIISLLNVLFD